MESQPRVYIATGLERAADHALVKNALARRNIGLTYDWTVHGSVAAQGVERLREVALLEMGGVLEADLVIVLLPGGKGTHAELGMALASGKKVLIHAQDPWVLDATPATCAFYHHPSVIRADVEKYAAPWFKAVALIAWHLMSKT
jgi:nucleoside 2-deoxyribosyltransferase